MSEKPGEARTTRAGAAPRTGETAGGHVAAATPAPSRAYVLDEGTRGNMAWRVTRLKTTDGRVRLAAEGAVLRSYGTARAWHETIVSAVSLEGSECHSGTYRQTLGPQIGTGLASATGRIYSFARRS